MSSAVPIVDFTACQLGKSPSDDQRQLLDLAKHIYNAFSTIGFVYLKNHGISQDLIQKTFDLSEDFFSLPESIKEDYPRQPGLKNHGWCQIGRERVNPERPGDYKEAYDVNPAVAKSWPPDSVIDGFQDTLEEMYDSCRQLSLRILNIMSIGLGLKDPEYFSSRHNMNRPTNTALRCLNYPAITHDTELEKNQLRCGEHTDYGTLTILFQDEVGGLEVFQRGKNYVPAPPIPGTVIVNLGDLMQRWTADTLVSTKHRVVNPVLNGGALGKSRQSIVCFIHPDEDCMVECSDGSNKYPPILAKDYLERRFKETFDY